MAAAIRRRLLRPFTRSGLLGFRMGHRAGLPAHQERRRRGRWPDAQRRERVRLDAVALDKVTLGRRRRRGGSAGAATGTRGRRNRLSLSGRRSPCGAGRCIGRRQRRRRRRGPHPRIGVTVKLLPALAARRPSRAAVGCRRGGRGRGGWRLVRRRRGDLLPLADLPKLLPHGLRNGGKEG